MVTTTGKTFRLRLVADHDKIAVDGEDVSFVTVEVVDSDGNVVPLVNDRISGSVTSGPGKVVATENGHPADFTEFTSQDRKAFHGVLLAIVKYHNARDSVITANSTEMKSASLSLVAT
ncbi:hypothetical protein GCG54_00003929 [Colletotrichum gloeosporioides]|uniref:Glycoside hydrolase family 2 domain-containing protein n=1 Tax=Colletotrichum gloeosporioides TaxID=474922 RepID=A0A8H4C5Z2_COLGL|nr:uncharacterized protein GCG54_00003929 [Colletotrichum gloeosporioides]KAF3798026.1 hypothetical protein GCG54_00003929 [Colletotrichum gloeosporioides]